jgi:hypothetical protein
LKQNKLEEVTKQEEPEDWQSFEYHENNGNQKAKKSLTNKTPNSVPWSEHSESKDLNN